MNRNELLPVFGHAQGEVAVGVEIVGDAMQLAGGGSNLPHLPVPVAGGVVKDEHQVLAIRHPRGLLQDGCTGKHGLLFSGLRIKQHHPAQVLTARIEDGGGDRLAIRRPRRIGISRQG